MTTRPGPRGKHQTAIMARLKRQPQNSYPMPCGATVEGRTLRMAIRRLAEKGLVQLESDGARYRIIREGK